MNLQKIKFRYRLLIAFLFVFIPLIAAGGILGYFQVKKIIQANIERRLEDNTDSLVRLIKTSAAVSVKNRLHAIAEKNREIARFYYERYKSGIITKSRAKTVIKQIFAAQRIGMSGYIYCLNSKGIIVIHPEKKLRNSDVSSFAFIREQIRRKNGYLEYYWKNPGESKKRAKALYMVYFKPFDWIISVSSYRKEFKNLVDINDFRDAVLACKSGKTGYSYMLAEKGTAIVHPYFQGVNILEHPDLPSDFLKEILKRKNGRMMYSWKNPGEIKPRMKLAIFRHLPEYKWIVVSSSYVDEVFAPLGKFKIFLLVFLGIAALLSCVITYLISASVTKPLESMTDKLEKGAGGDFSVRMDTEAPGEFGLLSKHFNFFMHQLEQKHREIEAESHKNMETRAALIENELKLRSLFNQSFQYIGILSPYGVLEEMNQSGLDFMGCTAEDVIYKLFWNIPFWRHDENERCRLKNLLEEAGNGQASRYETTIISKDDEIRNIDFSITPVFNTSGEVVFIITEARDITEFKQTAREREKLSVQLAKSQKMEAIGTLAGGIAHDFNNILSGILGYAQLAELNLESPAKARRHISQIVKGAQRAAGLTQQILTFSRQTEYEKNPLALYLVIKETVKLLRSSIPSTIEINEQIVSKAKVMADATQMHQVIMNLCTNAYHAMEETGGQLTVKLRDIEIIRDRDIFNNDIKPGQYMELEITDTGHGMSPEVLSKAFDPYFTTKDIGKGTGFGLSLVHAIVDEHGGYIKVKTSVGKGASFYVFLPIADNAEAAPVERSGNANNDLTTGDENIMVVDDEEDIRLILDAFLTDLGYAVFVFENGETAFKAFKNNPDNFDLVITDMTMPKMTGAELAQNILALRNDIPVILCTGYSETIVEAKAIEMGIKQYIQKPVDNNELALVIRSLLDGKKF